MKEIEIPDFEDVLENRKRLEELEGKDKGLIDPTYDPRHPSPSKIHDVVALTSADPATDTAVDGEMDLFDAEIVKRQRVSATRYKWVSTGLKVKVFNDFDTESIAVGQRFKVAPDGSTPYYQIVVYYC